uniref:CCHC-type domain-containing protein n=1 Tax=Dicentrarchus labrax TaxID=13489 RepID=A0A8P4FXX4_DICLA
MTPSSTISTNVGQTAFDVSKHIALVPMFRETEVDSYFGVFERIAAALQWPAEVWSLLLQCKIHGKAQDAIAALSLEESLSYDAVKTAILRAYELVPEAYRQKFRDHRKAQSQTYVEFAREKGVLFDKWTSTCKVNDFNSLRELILVEDFKKCLPERIVVYLNEQKVSALSAAAVLADEYVLTHKATFSSGPVEGSHRNPVSAPSPPSPSRLQRAERKCFYCHQTGHIIADCLVLKRKEQTARVSQPKGVGLIKAVSCVIPECDKQEDIDVCFKPFVFDALISLTGEPADQRSVRVLRDTASSQSVILATALPFSQQSACGYGSVLRGIEMGYVPRAVHSVHIQSNLVTGLLPVAVCSELPIHGIVLLMGNDIAGGKVTSALEVLDSPVGDESSPVPRLPSTVFPTCAITCACASKNENDVSDFLLAEGVFMSAVSDEAEVEKEVMKSATSQDEVAVLGCLPSPGSTSSSDGALPVTRERLIAAQRADPTLQKCFSSVVSNG